VQLLKGLCAQYPDLLPETISHKPSSPEKQAAPVDREAAFRPVSAAKTDSVLTQMCDRSSRRK